MGCVIERKGTTVVDGFIEHDDRPSTFEAAEALAGRQLDRRRNYAIIEGQVTSACTWSQACSGCYDGPDLATAKGSGCSECGYTGRRRQGQWLPLSGQDSK